MAELNGWWVTGLVDGEGCFYAGLQHRNKLNYASDNLIGRKGWLRRFPNEVDLLGSMCEDLRSVRTYSTLLAGVN